MTSEPALTREELAARLFERGDQLEERFLRQLERAGFFEPLALQLEATIDADGKARLDAEQLRPWLETSVRTVVTEFTAAMMDTVFADEQ